MLSVLLSSSFMQVSKQATKCGKIKKKEKIKKASLRPVCVTPFFRSAFFTWLKPTDRAPSSFTAFTRSVIFSYIQYLLFCCIFTVFLFRFPFFCVCFFPVFPAQN